VVVVETIASVLSDFFLWWHQDELANPIPFPRRINIETTSVCNLDCIMCPTQSKARDEGAMKMEMFERLADEISRHGADIVWLHAWGEPLVDKLLFERISCIKQYASIKNVVLSTNATLLRGEKANQLARSPLDTVVFSLDGVKAETYEAIRRGARFQAVMENVRQFLQARGSENGRGPRAVFQIIAMQETAEEIEAFKQQWRPYLQDGDYIHVKSFNTWAGKTKDRGLPQAGVAFRAPCTAFLWDALTVLWNGVVVPCCFDVDGSMVIGRFGEQTLEEIWNGQALAEMRREHCSLDFSRLPLCANCQHTHTRLNVVRIKNFIRARMGQPTGPAAEEGRPAF
jgi:radical SAM protein with 4Fe4S-binding SPASM domain